jgi:hypothetical protein
MVSSLALTLKPLPNKGKLNLINMRGKAEKTFQM